MMTAFDVLIPRRAGDEWRERIWGYTRDWWRENGIEPIEGHHDDGLFNRSAAINRAAAQANGRVLVIADADAIPGTIEQVQVAAQLAVDTAKLIRAYTKYHATTRHGAHQILDGHNGNWRKFIRWSYPYHLSSCVAVSRDLFDEVGGFDERFVGWGYEDRAFFEACSRLAGEQRVRGEVWHIWHPRSPEKDKTSSQYQANADLAQRYRAAKTPAEIRAILDER